MRRALAQEVKVWGGWQSEASCKFPFSEAQSRASHLNSHGSGASALLRLIEGGFEKPEPNMVLWAPVHIPDDQWVLYLT